MTAVAASAPNLPSFSAVRANLNARAQAFAARANDVDADGRLFARAFTVLVAFEVLRTAYVASTGVRVFETGIVQTLSVGILALALSFVTSRYRLWEATLVLRGGGTVAVTSFLFTSACVDVFHTGRTFALADATFEAADRALGLDWLSYARFLDGHPLLWKVTAFAYGSIFFQFALSVFLMAFSRSASRLYAYLLAQTLSLTVVALVAMVLPAIGAYEQSGAAHAGMLHQFLTADNMTSSIRWLRGDAVGGEGVNVFTLISFPSFHACSAVLFTWAAWRVPYVRWASLALNVAMMAATPVHGSHYFVDVIAGVAIASVSILVARRFMRTSPGASSSVAAPSRLAEVG